MEKLKIMGIRWVDMKTDDNRNITGYSLYVAFPAENVEGLQTAKLFVSASLWSALSHRPVVNEEVIVFYNRSGKVADIHAVKEK